MPPLRRFLVRVRARADFAFVSLSLAALALSLSSLPARAQVTTQTVDTGTNGDVGQYASMAVVAGNPAVAYYNAADGNLLFARNSAADGSGTWTPGNVATTGNVGQRASLAVVNGNPAIVFRDVTNGLLSFARNTTADGSGLWTTTTVDAAASGVTYLSLAFLSNNRPAVAYYDSANGDLKFAANASADGSGAWTITTIASTGDQGRGASLAVLPNGRPAVAFVDVNNREVKFAVNSAASGGGTWTTTTVASNGSFAGVGACSLAIVDGTPAISYSARIIQTNWDSIFYVRNTAADGSGTWTGGPWVEFGAVEHTLADVGGKPMIAFERYVVRGSTADGGTFTQSTVGSSSVDYRSLVVVSGNPALAYHESGNLYFARNSSADGSGTWTGTLADAGALATGTTGQFTSVALIGGAPAISYCDVSNGDLKFARNASAYANGAWTTTTVDATGNVGQHSVLAVIGGNPAIVYYDVTNADLKFARNSAADGAGTWTLGTVDSTGDVGQYPSVAVVSGNPAVAYHDLTNDDLKFARNSAADGSGTWTTSVVDSTGNQGSHASLAVVNGTPAISYRGRSDSSLKFARNGTADGSGTWTVVTVDNAGDVGQYTSLAIVGGVPVISYYDTTNTALKFARNSAADGSGTWMLTTIDNTAAVGEYARLAIINGLPTIAYYDATNGDLKLAQNTAADASGTWTITTPDATASVTVGQHASLAALGLAAGLAYHDATTADLKFAYVAGPEPEISVEQPALTVLADGGTKALGAVALGASGAAVTFTIRNSGAAALTDLAITKDGAHPADFAVSTLSATTVAPGGTATFTVTFTPGAAGFRTCVLHLANNDADENPCDLRLTGTGTPGLVLTLAQQAYAKPGAFGTTQAGDLFGYAIAISGDTVVVGAPTEDSSTTGVNSTPNESAADAGAAYVFVRNGTTWTQQAYLKASNAGAGDGFGSSVGISGDTIIVGAIQEDGSATGVNGTQDNNLRDAGAAYVFVRNGTTWTQQAYLKPSHSSQTDWFGYSVALSGDTAVVAAPVEDGGNTGVNSTPNEGASGAGAVFVFVRDGTTWTQQAYIKSDKASLNDNFGFAVAIDGDTLVVGAGSEDGTNSGVNSTYVSGATLSGAAYIFQRTGSTWAQQAYLKASNPAQADVFGRSVAISGDLVAVGAANEDSAVTGVNGTPDENATDAGAVYVFARSGGTWSQEAFVKPSVTGAGDQFGYSVALSGQTLVVGALGEDSSSTGVNSTPNESAATAGAAYVFTRSGTTWTQRAYFKASNPGTDDQFGWSVALSGQTLVVGALNEDSASTGVNGTPNEGAATAGAAYFFLGSTGGSVPTISDVADTSTGEDTATSPLALTLADADTPVTSLTLSGSSSNTTLVPNANIVFGGSGASRTVTLTPAANQTGTATITLTVSDGTASASDTFVLTVTSNVVTVANANDTGAGSLRQALIDVPAGGTITFDPTFFATPRTITLSSTLAITKSVTITGPGANRLTLGGNNSVRCLTADFTGSIALSGLTIANGRALNLNGGGLEFSNVAVTLTNCVFRNNFATFDGGAVRNNGASLTVFDCTFDGNTCGDAGADGGAVAHNGTFCSISGSTFVNNSASSGGALASIGGSTNLTVTNCTFSGNTATFGGAVEARSGGTFINCTMVGNSASSAGGLDVALQPARIVNTCIAGNRDLQGNPSDLLATNGGSLQAGSINNLVGTFIGTGLTNGVDGNQLGVTDPLFAPLGSYGGPTQTRPPYATSPALNAGTATGAPTTDQRGVARPQGAAVDIGAIEQSIAITPTTVAGGTQNSASTPVTFSASGGTTPYTWALLSGALPAGLTFNTATQTLSGTPTAAGSFTFALSATDASGFAGTASYTFIIAALTPPTISNVANLSTAEDTPTSAIAFIIGDTETAAASLTITATSSNQTLVPDANLPLGGSGANRTVTITPAANQTGTATITLTVTDGDSMTATDTFILTVTAVNDAPTISDVADLAIDEDTATTALAFTVGDAETAAASLTVTRASSNTTLVPLASVVLGGSGASRTVTLTPAANQSGAATITLTVSDGALTATDTFVLTVTAANDAPTISDVANTSTAEDTATSALAFTIGDAETSAASLTVTATSSNATLLPNANLVLGGSGANRTVTATPAANAFGTATITLTVNDGTATATDTFVLTVTAVNDAPTITGIADTTTNEDTPSAARSFTLGDLETAAASLTVTGTSSNTTLIPNAGIVFGGSGANRTVIVTPAANQNGTANITVTVSDGTATTSDIFVVTVTAVNDTPTLTAIANTSTAEDTATSALAFTVDDVETAAATLTVTGSSSNTTLVPDANLVFGGSDASRTLTVTPAANQTGTSTITVNVSDGAATGTRTFLLTVTAANDAPLISSFTDTSTAEDTATAAIPFTVGDVETAAAALTVSATSSNTSLVPNGNLALGGSGANRTLTATPAANQSGTATITVAVSDGASSTSSTFVLTVTAVNDAPTISNIADRSTNIDTATGAIAFTIGDQETAAASLTVTATSSNLTVVPAANLALGGSGTARTLTVTPAAGQTGTSTITVTVDDGTTTTSDTFVLSVVNGAPTVSAIADTTIAEDSATAALTFTVADNETPVASLTLIGASDNPTLVPNAAIVFGGSGANRTVTVTPAANQSGTATITVTASDGTLTGSTSFLLTVTAVNDVPAISNLADTATAEDTPTAALAFTVADLETAAGALTVSATSSNTTLIPHANLAFGGSGANRTLVATPAANESGTATITVTVSDGAATASDTFVLTVNAVNDTPTISGIPDTTIAEDNATTALAFTVSDIETAATALTVTATSSNLALVPNAALALAGTGAARTLVATPAANQSGTSTITVTVSDGAATASDTFVVTVTAVNDAPTISNLADRSTALNTATAAVPFTIDDLETAAASLTVTAVSSNPTVVPNANLALGGSGANRTLTATPATNQTGTATITVTVSDGALTASDTFVLTVSNGAPTLGTIADLSTAEDTPTAALAFTVSDTETPAASLVVSGTSDNLTLVPDANLVFAGSGANRTITVTPAANQSGTATITITVNDGLLTGTTSFVLTVTAVNDAPTITNLANTTTAEDTATPALAFTVGDLETAAASLAVSATSSNTALVPGASLVFGGSGTSRTLVATPAANQSGTSTITVTVSDGTTTASDTFVLTVTAVNDAPAIGMIADATIVEDSATSALAFTIGDLETAAASLTVTATSSNTTLVPDAALVLGGSDAARTITATPAANQSGTTTITVTVSDGTATASSSFDLTVTPVNDAPTISNLADRGTNINTPTSAIPFTIGDVETAAASLSVTATSSNTTLVPNANLALGGSGTSRTITLTPATGQTGTSTITVTVSDGALPATDTFVLTVNNGAPTISAIADLSIAEDAATSALAFTVADNETAPAALVVTATSDNLTLVPNANLVLGGSGANRTITVTPAANQSGTATITLSASDGVLTGTESFLLTVTAVNDAPTIGDIADTSTAEGAATSALAFTIGDLETATASLTVAATSSNLTLVPNANFLFGGSGANRTLTVTPAANQSGAATITVTVNDGTLTASDTFILTVAAGLPTVTSPARTALAATSATLGGNVTADGGSPVIARGVVLAVTATNANPRLLGTGVSDLAATGTTGVFTVPATGLAPLTAYSYSAYATNAAGTAYSAIDTFTTPAAPDTTPPTATITIAAAATLKTGDTAAVTIVFSEPVSGFANADLTIANGTLTPVATADNITFTATFTPTANVTAATNVITLDNTGVADFAANAGAGTTTSNNYAIDTAAPVFTSATIAGATYRSAFSFTVSATDAATLGATGLPAGLAFTAGTGVIAGTPTVAGTFPVALTATDTVGNVATSTLSLTVARVVLTVSGLVFADKTYDGSTAATVGVSGAALLGVIAPDIVTLNTASAAAAFVDAAIGSGKSITVSGLALTGADAANYTLTPPTGTASITAIPITTLSVTLGNLSHTYDGSPKSATVNVAGGSGTVSVTYNGSPTAPVNAGTYAVVASVIGTNATGSASGTLTIATAAQTLSFSLPTLAINQPTALSATASSRLPVAFALVSGHATLSGTTLTVLDANPVTVRATQGGNANYDPIFFTRTASAAGKLAQTIVFAAPADRLATADAFTLDATASSGLPVTLSVVSGPAFLGGAELTLTGATGPVVLRASQAGDAAYEAAPDVTVTFLVTSAGTQIFFGHVGDGVTDVLALVLAADGRSGTLVGTIPGTGEGFTIELSLDANGDWSVEAPVVVVSGGTGVSPVIMGGTPVPHTARALQTRTFRGHIAGGILTGSIGGAAQVLRAGRLASTGPAAALAGGYRAISPATTDSVLTFVVGATGRLYALATTPAYMVAASGTIDATGAFTARSADGATLNGSIDSASAAISGVLQRPGFPPESFFGLGLDVRRTDRLINLSSRVRVGPAAGRTLIAGFVVGGGDGLKRVLLRAVGPALGDLGVAGALANPRLQLFDGAGKLVAENDDWSGSDLTSAFARLGAFALAPASRDAALFATLAPGSYTMHVIDGGENGVALAEIYDASVNPSSEYQRLINISSRGEAGPGPDVLIGGFVVTGNFPKRVLVRGIGPALGSFGLTGTLADPRLKVYSGGTVVGENDNWGTLPADATAVAAAARATGAFALSAGSRDAAVILTLPPGAYTAQVSPADGATPGVALVEIYEVP